MASFLRSLRRWLPFRRDGAPARGVRTPCRRAPDVDSTVSSTRSVLGLSAVVRASERVSRSPDASVSSVRLCLATRLPPQPPRNLGDCDSAVGDWKGTGMRPDVIVGGIMTLLLGHAVAGCCLGGGGGTSSGASSGPSPGAPGSSASTAVPVGTPLNVGGLETASSRHLLPTRSARPSASTLHPPAPPFS
jgi:hypothetical protein